MSVSAMNRASELVLPTVVGAAGYAAASYLINSPIRPVTASHFGALQGFLRIPVTAFINRVFHVDKGSVSDSSKTLAAALSVFASYGLTWMILAEAGIVFSLAEFVLLVGFSFLTKAAIQYALDVIKDSQ